MWRPAEVSEAQLRSDAKNKVGANAKSPKARKPRQPKETKPPKPTKPTKKRASGKHKPKAAAKLSSACLPTVRLVLDYPPGVEPTAE